MGITCLHVYHVCFKNLLSKARAPTIPLVVTPYCIVSHNQLSVIRPGTLSSKLWPSKNPIMMVLHGLQLISAVKSAGSMGWGSKPSTKQRGALRLLRSPQPLLPVVIVAMPAPADSKFMCNLDTLVSAKLTALKP